RIVNLGLTLPEIGLQSALNAKMPQLQFNVLRPLREIPAHVIRSHVQSSHAMTFALRFNHHKGTCSSYRLRVGSTTANRERLTKTEPLIPQREIPPRGGSDWAAR